MTEKLVIIGNGMATGRMLEHLRPGDRPLPSTIIFNAEPRVNYDRIMLSPVLPGEDRGDHHPRRGLVFQNSISLYKGHKNVGDRPCGQDGRLVPWRTQDYNKDYVIATSSMPLIIPVPGHDLPGVLTYRDLDDVNAMLIAAQSRDKAVVIGGGLLGLEAAAGLAARGMESRCTISCQL